MPQIPVSEVKALYFCWEQSSFLLLSLDESFSSLFLYLDTRLQAKDMLFPWNDGVSVFILVLMKGHSGARSTILSSPYCPMY